MNEAHSERRPGVGPERLWRVRKNHTWIDARVTRADDAVVLQLWYDGSVVFTRSCASHAAARAAAGEFLSDLQRSGWTAHW
jgi:hypothetical protein